MLGHHSNGPQVSNHIDPRTHYLTYSESTVSLLGYLGADIFVNKMLNRLVMSDLRECMRNLLCDELFNWAFGDDDEDDQKKDEFDSHRATAPSLA